jgi:hypothetical protein
MKSTPLPAGASFYAQEYNALRSDARAASWLKAHQQFGALALPTNPSDGQTISLVVNGTTVILTGRTGALSLPGDFQIQGTAVATTAVIAAAAKSPTVTTASFIGFNTPTTAANAVLIQYLGYALVPGSTTIVPYSLNTSTYAPLTSFTASTTVTGANWTAQTMQLYIEEGTYYIGTTRVIFTGGSTPTLTAPSANPRIDIVTADSFGAIAVTQGTENASPVAPAYPTNKVVICEVYNVVGETSLYDTDNQQAGQGYISNDVRMILQPVYIGSSSQVATQLFIPWIASPANGDLAYYNGSAWARLPVGSANQILSVLFGVPTWTGSVVTSKPIASSWTTSNTGLQTIAHGLSKPPQQLRITMIYTSGASNYFQSIGSYNGANTATVWLGLSAGGAITSATDTTYIIVFSKAGGTTSAQATVTVDATNVNLTWSKNGTPTDTIPFIVEVIG